MTNPDPTADPISPQPPDKHPGHPLVVPLRAPPPVQQPQPPDTAPCRPEECDTCPYREYREEEK